MTTVALVLIGNELLTGKIKDQNGHFLAQACFNSGAKLQSVSIIPDTHDAIAETINRVRHEVDIVITSGGVGPTHDDITYEGIAQALDVDLAPNNVLMEQIEHFFGPRTTDAHRTMACLPSGAQLEFPAGANWPTVRVQNIYIFPGVPQIFQQKLLGIIHHLSGPRKQLRILKIKGDEGTIASHLAWAEEKFEVDIGSYPLFGQPEINIHVTVESHNTDALTDACEALVLRLTPVVSTIKSDTDP